MFDVKWWRFLRSLGLEFWLPLPLLGLAFWFVSGLLTEHSLRQSDRPVESFIITLDKTEPISNILFIKVTVDRDRDISLVKVKTATQVYEKQEFAIATTELERVETEIAQKLGLPPEKVRELLRYKIE